MSSDIPHQSEVDSDSDPGDIDPAIDAFLEDLDRGIDHDEAIRRHSVLRPDMAAKYHRLAMVKQRLGNFAASGPPVAPPTRLGDFEIVREIGRGGMGMVYEARQHPIDRRVAVKTIRRRSSVSNASLVERFEREQKVLARLHHTNIIPIFAAGRDGSLDYYAMHYVEGCSLNSIVDKTSRFHASNPSLPTPTPTELMQNMPRGDESKTVSENSIFTPSPRYTRIVASAIAEAADAISHAHAHGILHRDLKPGNLMLDTQGHCWVLDFGLAAVVESVLPAVDGLDEHVAEAPSQHDSSGTKLAGTWKYLAPERLKAICDGRADVWGLGVTLSELLTLKRPDQLKGSADRQNAIHSAPYNKLPRDLAAICITATKSDPDERYKTSAALRDDLRGFLAGEPVMARPPWLGRQLWLFAKRKPALSSAIMIVLVLSLGWLIHARDLMIQVDKRDHDLQVEKSNVERLDQLVKADQLELSARREAFRIQKAKTEEENALNLFIHAERLASEAKPALGLQAIALEFIAGSNRTLETRYRHHFSALARLESPLFIERLMNGPHEVRAASIRPDGRQVAFLAASGEISVRDVGDGTSLRVIGRTSSANGCLTYTPSGSMLVVGTDQMVQIYATNGDDFRPRVFQQTSPVSCLAAFPDGEHLAVGGMDGKIRVWSIRTGTIVRVLGEGGTAVTAIAASSPAQKIISGYKDGAFRVWSNDSAQPFFEAKVNGPVTCVALSPDASIATVGELTCRATIQPLRAGMAPKRIDLDAEVTAVAFDPSGTKIVAASGDSTIRVWNVDGSPLTSRVTASHNIISAAWARDGSKLIVIASDGEITIRPSVREHMSVPLFQGAVRPTSLIAVSPNRRWVIVAEADHFQLFSCKPPGSIGPLQKMSRRVSQVAFDPDSESFLVATEDGELKRFDNRLNPRPHTKFDGSHVTTIAFRDDGIHLVGMRDGSIQVFKKDHSAYQAREFAEDRSPVTAAALSPRGDLFVVGHESGMIQLWRTIKGPKGGHQPHGSPITAAAFSNDGSSFVVGTADGRVQLWNEDLERHGPLFGTGGTAVESLAFAADGLSFALSNADGKTRIVDSTSIFNIGVPTGTPDVSRIKILPDGHWTAEITKSDHIRFTRLPRPVEGDPSRLRRWVESRLGTTQTPSHSERHLTETEWLERSKEIGDWNPTGFSEIDLQ
jgi:WD40 repeat protein/serine/threonine protein kinase